MLLCHPGLADRADSQFGIVGSPWPGRPSRPAVWYCWVTPAWPKEQARSLVLLGHPGLADRAGPQFGVAVSVGGCRLLVQGSLRCCCDHCTGAVVLRDMKSFFNGGSRCIISLALVRCCEAPTALYTPTRFNPQQFVL